MSRLGHIQLWYVYSSKYQIKCMDFVFSPNIFENDQCTAHVIIIQYGKDENLTIVIVKSRWVLLFCIYFLYLQIFRTSASASMLWKLEITSTEKSVLSRGECDFYFTDVFDYHRAVVPFCWAVRSLSTYSRLLTGLPYTNTGSKNLWWNSK